MKAIRGDNPRTTNQRVYLMPVVPPSPPLRKTSRRSRWNASAPSPPCLSFPQVRSLDSSISFSFSFRTYPARSPSSSSLSPGRPLSPPLCAARFAFLSCALTRSHRVVASLLSRTCHYATGHNPEPSLLFPLHPSEPVLPLIRHLYSTHYFQRAVPSPSPPPSRRRPPPAI